MMGMHLSGRDALSRNLNIHYVSPLLVGQQAELEARVAHISEATSSIELKFKITSQGKTLAKGSAGVQILKPDGQ